jgi:glycosyltransferase involved in cell wall biosynthesis
MENKKMNKLVSIITTAYNSEKYLQNYFEGILSQNYKNIELIFVDDGSLDDTRFIFLNYKKKFEKIFKGKAIYIYQENKGIVAALRNGLSYCQGEYIVPFDSDDIMLSHKVKSHVDFLEKKKDYGLVYSDAYIVKENRLNNPINTFFNKKKPLSGFLYEKILTKENWVHSTTYCFRKECLNKIPKLTDEFDSQGNTLQVVCGIAFYYKIGFNNVPPVAKYVIHSDSMSHEKSLKNFYFKAFTRKELDNYIINNFGISKEAKIKLEKRYLKKEFQYYFFNIEKKNLIKTYKKLSNLNIISLRIKVLFLITHFKLLWKSIVKILLM